MKRLSAGVLAALLTLGVVGLFPAAASAAPTQTAADFCFPGSSADYPPTGARVEIQVSLTLLSGQFNPGARGSIVISGATPNLTYCGTLFSTPVSLPETADPAGRLTYNIAVPADFELGAMHHIDMFRQQKQVGSFDFCVNKSGAVAPTSSCAKTPTTVKSAGPLAKTGTNSMVELLRVAVVALGLGAGALYLKRRRDQATA